VICASKQLCIGLAGSARIVLIALCVEEDVMAAPFLMALHGELTVIGKSPDGDSMRFIPDTSEALEQLARADRIRVTKSDGSVQLRLDGIDAPETHFGPFAQPLGEMARDWLLEQTGFSD
jgi:endonuclease YncB( thermonuclease family)